MHKQLLKIRNVSHFLLLNYCASHFHGEERSTFSHAVAMVNYKVDEKLPEILVARVFASCKVNGLVSLLTYYVINLHA